MVGFFFTVAVWFVIRQNNRDDGDDAKPALASHLLAQFVMDMLRMVSIPRDESEGGATCQWPSGKSLRRDRRHLEQGPPGGRPIWSLLTVVTNISEPLLARFYRLLRQTRGVRLRAMTEQLFCLCWSRRRGQPMMGGEEKKKIADDNAR